MKMQKGLFTLQLLPLGCVKVQMSFSHFKFLTLWVWKWNRSSPWSHARGTSGKGLPFPRRTQQQTKLFFLGGEMNRSLLQIITELLSSQQILQLSFWYFKHSEISATNKVVECFCWRSGVCCWGPNSVMGRLLLLTLAASS